MAYKVDNAVIMAAGTASRFAPLSYERPKALIMVKGEVLIERQIRQLQEAGISDVYIITGYKAEMFDYLRDKFGVTLIHNPMYLSRNNNSSIHYARDVLKNTYICSADNYFTKNPFETEVDDSYYAAVYADGPTAEWCLETDDQGYINRVQIGGENSWYMLGHTFWSEDFSQKFIDILEREYDLPETADKLWESIYMDHLDELKMKMRKYDDDFIFEFDSLDELRVFDQSYFDDAHSEILKDVANRLCVQEKNLTGFKAHKSTTNAADGFEFICKEQKYCYLYSNREIQKI